jgi:branched-chain amino acid transport system substrate-binding protein
MYKLAIAAMVCAGISGQALAADKVVKIGVLNDRSGIFEDITGAKSVEAAKMAIDDFGEQNRDYKIELLSADHQNKADVAGAIARRWIDIDGVDVIADATNSTVALALQEVARTKRKILLVASAATSDLTGKSCAETSSQWSYDTYSVAKSTSRQLVQQGGKKWFFITADYAFGHAMERDATAFIKEGGGEVVGSVKAPPATFDYSSFLLQAQASKADIIALATGSTDTINAVKQAAEFGVTGAGQRLAGLLTYINDVDSLGLKAAQGLTLTTSFYWDMNDETRAWTKRFWARAGDKKPPNMLQAGLYAAITHYLKSVKAAGTTDAEAVARKMKELPVSDFYNKNVKLREDGRVLHRMYLMEVKKPEESKYPFDYYKLISELPGEEAYRSLADGGCPLLAPGVKN